MKSQALVRTRRATPKIERRYTVALASTVARDVARYAKDCDVSMSKAIANLVRFGLDSQADRKKEFFAKLRENLENGDPAQEDRLVDDFRALILGQ